jgi:hypothetical protein
MKRKKLNFIGFAAMMITIFYGCCGGFPGMGGGIDCTNYKASRQMFITMNMDSLNNGFKLAELDSTYIILFVSDSIEAFKEPIDTVVFLNSSNIYNYSSNNLYGFQYWITKDNSKTGNYSLKNSFKIYNSNSSIINEISNIEIELLQNEKKCCQEYSDDNIKSYKLNGIQKTGNSIIIDKK